MAYGERGWNGVFSFCGLCDAFPNISDDDAWYILQSKSAILIASSRFSAPKPVTAQVEMGCSNDILTCDCAARLYTSSGRCFFKAFTMDGMSSRSPYSSTSLERTDGSMWSSLVRWSMVELRLTSPTTLYPLDTRSSAK